MRQNQNALTLRILDKLSNDELILPTLPDIALRVQNVAEQEDSEIEDVAATISTDAALTSRIIRYSNTVLVRGNKHITDIKEACMRIGLNKIKTLAMALALEQLFVASNDQIKIHMHNAWMTTVTLTSHTLAAFDVCDKQPHLNIDTMFLTALVHNVGVLAVLNEAENNPDVFAEKKFLEETAARLCPVLGGQILTKWEFDQTLIHAVEHWQQPDAKDVSVLYADFLRLGAALADMTPKTAGKVIKMCKKKNMFKDDAVFKSKRFNEIRDAVLASFL